MAVLVCMLYTSEIRLHFKKNLGKNLTNHVYLYAEIIVLLCEERTCNSYIHANYRIAVTYE